MGGCFLRPWSRPFGPRPRAQWYKAGVEASDFVAALWTGPANLQQTSRLQIFLDRYGTVVLIFSVIISGQTRQTSRLRRSSLVSFLPSPDVQPPISNAIIFCHIRLVIPLYRYIASTYLLCLPLLRKLPGCIPILPILELGGSPTISWVSLFRELLRPVAAPDRSGLPVPPCICSPG